MLKPNNDRIDFGKSLRCNIDGYVLDFAIGTSYTLDLEAMIFLPVSLFFDEDFEVSDKLSNEMLTALTQVPDKVQIFCQKGKIKVPSNYHQVLEYWSENIEQVEMDDYDRSFHPKIWLVRYIDKDKNKPAYYKFICTSRNLTRSVDWDIAVTMQGFVGKEERGENLPLLDFVKFLDSKATKRISKEILQEISKIQYDLGKENHHYKFFPIGNGWENPVFHTEKKYDDLLCISPFLDITSTKKLSEKSKNLFLLSTKYELDKLPINVQCENMELYNFNTTLEWESALADENASVSENDLVVVAEEAEFCESSSLHAKLFVAKKGKEKTWFIGSANCTSPASTNRNIEFLTSISSTDASLLEPKEILQILTEVEKNSEGFFVPYEKKYRTVDEEEENLRSDLRKTVFDISKITISASVKENKNGFFDYTVEIFYPKIFKRENWKIYIQPLSGMMGKRAEILEGSGTQIFQFKDFQIHRLTPYFQFIIVEDSAEIDKLVIKLNIEFPEIRMKKIFSSLIENWDKLMKYISFLLTKENVEQLLDLKEGSEDLELTYPKKSNGQWQSQFPIYEKMLVASSRDEYSLRETIKVIELLENEIGLDGKALVDEKFITLIKTFKDFLPNES